MSQPLIPATVIGSWSFPGWYEQFNNDVKANPEAFGARDRDEALRDAVLVAVADQLRAGLDRITDGEMQRVDFNFSFYDFLDGLVTLPPTRKLGPEAHDQRNKYLCEEKLTAPRGLGTVAEYKRLREVTGASIKMTMPDPFHLAGSIQPGEVYRDREAITEDLIPIVNAELKAAVAAGIGFLQLNAPCLAWQSDDMDHFLDVVNRTTDGVDAYISMHLGFGNYRSRSLGRRSYKGLFPHLEAARISQVALVFAAREMAEVELLKELPATLDVAVGLIDVKNCWIEPAALVAERLRTVLQYVDAERVSVVPDYGFSQTARYLATAKTKAMVDGVRIIRAELGKGR